MTCLQLSYSSSQKPLSDFFGKGPSFEDILIADYSKFERMDKYHFFTQAVLAFSEKHQRFPAPGSEVGVTLTYF